MKTDIRANIIRPAAKLAILTLTLLGVALLPSRDAQAVAFRLPNQDPLAIARANAFAATANNPAAIYYNPAGITQLEGQNLSVGLYLVSAGHNFTSTTGAKASVDCMFQPVPQLYYTYTPKESDFSFGVGLYVPYGLSLDWGYDPPFRNVAQSGSLLYVSLNPVIAWKVLPDLSIAVGPTLNYSKATLNRGLGIIPNDQFHFVGDAFDAGFNAGILWHPLEQWSFGVNYRYQTTMDYEGHSTTEPSPPLFTPQTTTGSLHFPQFVVLGVSYRPTTNWNIEFDYDWTDWDSVNEIVFKTQLGNNTLPLNYQSSSMYEFGVTRYFDHGWNLSAGYFYSENSVPELWFNPIVPDSVLHLISFGVGHTGEKWGWNFSYTFAINPGRDVNNSVFGPTVSGTYRTINNALNFAVNRKF